MTDTKKMDEEAVALWLAEHPDLFQRRPELLDDLELPHSTDAHSLIEVQVTRLRRENHQLRTQLETLAGIAGENERLMQRLHSLTLDVMDADSPAAFIERLLARLQDDFHAHAVRLHLLEASETLASLTAVSTHESGAPDWFGKLLERKRVEFGRFTRAKLELLFPEVHEQIASAALLPIGQIGLLAIGADEAERFHPQMGTLFLELLAHTIEHRLRAQEDAARKRA